MKRLVINSAVLFAIFLMSACSRNGFEGSVVRYGDEKALSNIIVEAKTKTDIREQMSKAHKTDKTNSAGQFKISGLIPKGYQVQVRDPKYISSSIYAYAPEKGTKVIEKPLTACPLPPGKGIWIYEFGSSKFNRLELEIEKKVVVKVHAGLIGGGFGNRSAFSVANDDTNKVCAEIERGGLLIISGGGVKDIAQLHKISKKTVSLGGRGKAEIEEGWYYNIRDFYGKDFMIVGRKLLKAKIQAPYLKNALNIKKRNLWAIPLKNFSSGLHILTTEVASGQRASSILGGESHPREGYLIRIK